MIFNESNIKLIEDDWISKEVKEIRNKIKDVGISEKEIHNKMKDVSISKEELEKLKRIYKEKKKKKKN